MVVERRRRLSLVAGYDRSGIIHDHVVFLLKKVSEFSDVYYYADNEIHEEERQKILPFVKYCGGHRHSNYDFGSWALLLEKIGWENIVNQELILVNDSCYGPFFDLHPIIDKMSERNCDFWGMTSSHEIAFHIQSYFMVFKRTVLSDIDFQRFWSNVNVLNYEDAVNNYEVRLSKLLRRGGYSAGTWVETSVKDNVTLYPATLLVKYNCPFFKIKCVRDSRIALKERIVFLYDFIRGQKYFDMSAIRSHIGPKCFENIWRDQRDFPPFSRFFLKIFNVRSVKGRHVRFSIYGRKLLIVTLGRRMITFLSRLRSLRPNI